MAREYTYKEEVYIMFGIYEVYYNEDGIPDSYTSNPIDTNFDSFKGLRWSINKIKLGMKKPILWYGDRFPDEYKENNE